MLEKVKGGLSMRDGETRLTNEKPPYHWPEQTASARILPDRFTRLKEIYCKDLAYVTVEQLSRSKIHKGGWQPGNCNPHGNPSSAFRQIKSVPFRGSVTTIPFFQNPWIV